MNRYRDTAPYVFRPPMYSRFWAPLIYLVSDSMYLRRKYRVTEVRIASGLEKLLELRRQGHSILIAPNHSDHADPHTLMHVARRHSCPLHFIAAREIFLPCHGLNGRILQRAGVFSIDREGTDLRAVKQAMQIVDEGKYPLVMFPEGEIFHLNERLTPLNDGVAVIALRAARRLIRKEPGRRVAVLPAAIRYRYQGDVSATFAPSLDRLERQILWHPQDKTDIVDRVYKFGEALLTLKEKEYLDTTLSGDVPTRLATMREALISEAERRYAAKASTGTHPERVRHVRGRIRALVLADPPPPPEEMAEHYAQLDRIYAAVQMYSYPGQYVTEKPTQDRIAETIIKFEEDVFGVGLVKGRRRADITFCDPIYADAHLDADGGIPRTAAEDMTSRTATAIQAALE